MKDRCGVPLIEGDYIAYAQSYSSHSVRLSFGRVLKVKPDRISVVVPTGRPVTIRKADTVIRLHPAQVPDSIREELSDEDSDSNGGTAACG